MRLAGQIKMGHYPTPDSVSKRIRGFLQFPHSREVTLLDPCCGEGQALAIVAEESDYAHTFGIELDRARANAAKKRLETVVTGGYEEVELSPEGFSLLLLNPPYDNQEGERKEYVFLRDLLTALPSGGVLVYIIPQERLNQSVAEFLSANFTDVRVYRFPDPEYEAFGQIVIFAKRSAWSSDTKTTENELLKIRGMDLPSLPDHTWTRYPLPTIKKARIRLRDRKPEDLSKMADTSPLKERLSTLLDPPSLKTELQPPIPPHQGHLGLLLAAGWLNGKVGEGEQAHVVAGRPEKHIVERTSIEGDEEVHRRLETFRVHIKVLQQDGTIRSLT